MALDDPYYKQPYVPIQGAQDSLNEWANKSSLLDQEQMKTQQMREAMNARKQPMTPWQKAMHNLVNGDMHPTDVANQLKMELGGGQQGGGMGSGMPQQGPQQGTGMNQIPGQAQTPYAMQAPQPSGMGALPQQMTQGDFQDEMKDALPIWKEQQSTRSAKDIASSNNSTRANIAEQADAARRDIAKERADLERSKQEETVKRDENNRKHHAGMLDYYNRRLKEWERHNSASEANDPILKAMTSMFAAKMGAYGKYVSSDNKIIDPATADHMKEALDTDEQNIEEHIKSKPKVNTSAKKSDSSGKSGATPPKNAEAIGTPDIPTVGGSYTDPSTGQRGIVVGVNGGKIQMRKMTAQEMAQDAK